jgi:Zn-dependent peptidase ImmA (M78 family)
MGIKKSFKPPVTEIKINNLNDIEDFANKVRNAWNLGTDPISNVSELLEENHIKVIELETKDGFDGMQTWVNGKEVPVIALNISRLTSSDRKRFTALHELGHLLLPLDGVDEKLAEKYCHRFAGAMLFPKDAVEKELGGTRNKISIQELGLIKEQYGISIQAMIYRLHDLHVISDHYKKYYYQYINQMGWKVEEPYEYKGKVKSSRFDQLIFRALSEDIISMSKAASLKNMKLSEFRTKFLSVG